jgi:CshA-type fibril repeat protein
MSGTTRARRTVRLAVASALVAAAGLSAMVLPGSASAEGSRGSYPSSATCGSTGSCRADIEWRTNSYGPTGSTILRRTLFSVYAKQGEVLEMGSSAVGVDSGDIVVWNPDRITDDQAATLPAVTSGTNGFRCSDQRAEPGSPATAGMITSRGQEQAGPQAVTGGGNSAGYVPCHYQAPTTGLYKVAFYGPAGPNSNVDGSPTGDLNLASGGNFDTTQGTSVAAWDLTVRADDAGATDITGRVFTFALAAFTGANSRPIDQTLYATTLDGYEYRVDTNGLDPNGFVIYGNEQGFLDPEGNPLNHDVLGNGSQMNVVQGGVKLAPPTYPISFSRLSQDTLDALHIDDTPTVPVLSDLRFDGAHTGSNTYLGHGGTFTFDQNVHGTYSIVISRDGSDFDPGKPTNRVLQGVEDTGTHSVVWNGKDNAGDPFPVGTGYAVRAQARAGVYHFPLLDAENSTKGGPSFTLLNAPGGDCPFGNNSCTTSFYDDRGYHTSVADVGTPGRELAGGNPPGVDHADASTGYVSTSGQRAWGGTGSTGFGDAKGLDSWTYFPSTTESASLNVIAVPDAPATTNDTGTVQVDRPLSVLAADGVLANDGGTSLTVTAHTDPAHGTLGIRPDGAYTYTPAAGFSGHDSFGYTATDPAGQHANATVGLTVRPQAVANSASTQAGHRLHVTAAHGVLVNDRGRTLAVTGHTAASHGTVHVYRDGSYTYTARDGWSGRDSFRYTATDAANQSVTATVEVAVTPSALADTAWTALATPIALDPLRNDVGTALRLLSVRQPDHGTVLPYGRRLVLVPARGFAGTVRFHYTVRDAAGQTSSAEVSVRVRPTDTTIAPDKLSTDPGKSVTFDPTANDPGRGSFVDGTLMLADARLKTFVRTLPTKAGTFTVDAATGKVQFSPAHGFVGRVWNVSYVVSDQAGRLHHSTIMVHIGDRAGAPGRTVGGGRLQPGRDVVPAADTTEPGLKPGRVITGQLASTGNPVGPALPLGGAAMVGVGVLLVRRRPTR